MNLLVPMAAEDKVVMDFLVRLLDLVVQVVAVVVLVVAVEVIIPNEVMIVGRMLEEVELVLVQDLVMVG